MHLIVIQEFGGYAKGDRIEDPKKVAEVLSGEHQSFVVKVAAPAIA